MPHSQVVPHAEDKPVSRASHVQKRPSTRPWMALLRERSTLVMTVVGLAVTSVAFLSVRERERDEKRHQLEASVREVGLALRAGFATPVDVIEALPPVFSTVEPRRAMFEAVARPMIARHRSLAFVEWAPRVEGSARADFETAARNEGVPGYEIREPSGTSWMRSPVRPSYFPLLYAEPYDPVVLGLDVAFEPARRVVQDESIATGKVRTSPQFKLAEDPNEKAVAVYAPVYEPGSSTSSESERRAHVRGLAIGIFRIREVVERALDGSDLLGMRLVLRDEVAPEELAVLYDSERMKGKRDSPPVDTLASVTTYVDRFEVAGRSWRATFQAAPDAFDLGSRAWVMLVAGLVCSVVLGAGAGSLSMMRRLRREAAMAEHLGQYRLVRKIGKGGMGSVYEADHALLRRRTAVKLITPGSELTPEFIARFEREVLITSQLGHPNTVQVYDFGRSPNGVFYYAMEYIDGLTLEELVRRSGPLPAARVVHLLSQVGGALAEAHAAGLVHRDVKPANIMICVRGGIYDFAKVLDFGLVKEVDDASSHLTHAGELVGTPLYSAPESVSAPDTVGPAADIYSLGATAYFMLTGNDVFRGPALEVVAQHLSTIPPPPSKRTDNPIPARLEKLVLGCLEKEPEDRPLSARDFVVALERSVEGRWSDDDARDWWTKKGARLLSERDETKRRGSLIEHGSVRVDLRPRGRQQAKG